MDALRVETIRNVRSCLVIVKGALDIRQLAKDYNTFMNTPIPFKKLGFNSLEDFLRSDPSLVLDKQPNGQVLVDAIPDPRSKHIGEMVARQKDSKKKKNAPLRPKNPQQPKRWRPVNVVSNGQHQQYANNSPRIAQHNQFITSPRKWQQPQAQYQHQQQAPTHHQYSGVTNQHVQNNLRNMSRMQISPEQNKPTANKENQRPSAALLPLPEVVAAPKEEKTNITAVMQRARERLSSTAASVSGSDADDRNQFCESGDVSKDLWNFTRFRRIEEPQVNCVQTKTKSQKRPQFYCKVKVDGSTFSSYPEEFHDEKSAVQYSTKLALEQLLKKYGRTRKQSIPITVDSSIIERVPSLIGKHYNGVWSWQVEADYKDLYNEALPANWLEIIDVSPMITVEQFGDKFVLRVCNPQDKGKVHSALACDVSIPTSSANFDENGFMTARVTCAVSAGEVWCRQICTEEATAFDTMCEQMNKHYNDMFNQNARMLIERCVKGHYYAAWDKTWHRAQALEVRENGLLCLMVDRGDDCFIPFENIYALHRQYARERAQAFVCRLAGLDELYEASQFTDAIIELEDAEITLELIEDTENEEDAKKIVSVVMYDIETGVEFNTELMAMIAIENTTHTFDIDKSFEVHVSHIAKDGLFYVQVRSPGYNVLNTMMTEQESELPKYLSKHTHHEAITRQNCKDKLYFAKLEDDSCYNRVKIIDSPEDFKYAQILYVDHGNTRVIKLSNVTLIPLDKLNPLLAKFPPQATLVRMQMKRIPSDLAAKMTELLPQQASLLLRVQSKDEKGIPSVMLFVPNVSGLVSVNDSLSFENFKKEPISPLSPNGRFTPPDSPHNVPSTGVLQAPHLPNSKEYFEVKVPFAVNPWNFFIQPRDTANQLAEMMSKLQATFANRHVEAVNLKDIKAGSIYAAKRDDGVWCRVCVLKTIYPSAIVVFYVDFGYYANLNYQNLFSLDKHFLELPYQAIKAKLAGIKPIQEKWSVNDCRYFEKLVQQREYVSVIIALENDELYPCDKVLVLKLIDTESSNQDVVIGDLLIQKKIAVRN